MRFSTVLAAAIAVLGAAAACPSSSSSSSSSGGPEAAGVKASYSKSTSKLELITCDTNKDGTRLVLMEVDRNFDRVVDRWEDYDANGSLERVGFSRAPRRIRTATGSRTGGKPTATAPWPASRSAPPATAVPTAASPTARPA
jgi:hypothetical protein